MTQHNSCNLCGKRKPQQGGTFRLVCGVRCWVCVCCKAKK
jgi:hypothetical protein